MKLVRPIWASALVLALTTPSAFAEPITFQIDQGHSNVGFSVRHFFSRVPGRFNKFSGTVTYDDKNVSASAVDVTIETASIFTNNDRRDADLRSSNFFLADSFPSITFKSTKVSAGEGGKLKVDGDLTMHGITKPVTLDATVLGVGAVGMGGRSMMRAGFEGTTTINRKDWGIVWNQALDQGGTMLGDEVRIDIGIEGRVPPPGGMMGGPPPGSAQAPPVKK